MPIQQFFSNFDWNEPRDKFNPDDLKASEIANQFWLGWYANPVYMNGDYPYDFICQLTSLFLPSTKIECNYSDLK
jgi:hypothetical protein